VRQQVSSVLLAVYPFLTRAHELFLVGANLCYHKEHRRDSKPIIMAQKILIVLLLITSLIPSMFLGGGSLRYMPVFVALFLTVLYCLYCLKKKGNRDHLITYTDRNASLLIIVVLYIVMIWISALTMDKGTVAFVAGISFVLLVMHIFFPLLVNKREDVIFIAHTLLCICLFNCIIAAVFFILDQTMNTQYGVYKIQWLSAKLRFLPKIKISVLKGIFSNPNSLGMLITAVLPALLYLIKEDKRFSRSVLVPIGLLFAFTLFHTFSRSSILAVSFVLTSFLVLIFAKRFMIILKMLTLPIILAFPFLILFGINVSFMQNDIMMSKRIPLWNHAIETIRDNMFFGIGILNTEKILSRSSHNTFVETALGFGSLAMILYSAYLLAFLLKMRSDKDPALSQYALLTFLSFSILQIFETLLFGGMSIANFYFLIVIVSYLSVTSSQPRLPRSFPE
jgi:O-antigen ligase